MSISPLVNIAMRMRIEAKRELNVLPQDLYEITAEVTDKNRKEDLEFRFLAHC